MNLIISSRRRRDDDDDEGRIIPKSKKMQAVHSLAMNE
jgi:hypothetical protein